MSEYTPRKKRRSFDFLKAMEIGLAAVLVVVLGLVIAGFVPFSHPRLSRVAIAAITKNGADSCGIGSVQIIPWKGISLHDVSVSGQAGIENRFVLNARRVDVQCNFLLLALSRTKLISLLAGKDSAFAARWRAGSAGASLGLLRIAGEFGWVKRLSVANLGIVTEKKGGTRFEGEGISANLSVSEGKHFFRGSFSTAGMAVSGFAIAERMDGEFLLDGGRVALTKCKGKTNDGKFSCGARFDLEKGTLSAFSLSIDGAGLPGCNGLDTGGRCAGKADLRLTLDSSDCRADSLRGSGSVNASSLVLAGFAFQRSLAGMLSFPGLAQLHFKKFKTDFRIKPGRIIETLAQGESDSLSVKVTGWFRADGALNEKVECVFHREYVAAFPPFARTTLEETPDGGRGLRCRIYGTVGDPKFEIDSRTILQKAVRNMFEDVKNNVQQWLK